MNIKRALVSVSDKEGIIDFVRELHNLDVQIISTGGTSKAISEAGIPVTDVSEVTGFPEIMDGRVKTLHPKVHGGILARRDKPEHLKAISDLGINTIDMVVVNLYPFEKVTQDPDISLETAIENIDIGGPSMLRAAAKNYKDVVVITDPNDYSPIIEQLKNSGEVDGQTRAELAVKVYHRTAEYDAAIDTHLSRAIMEENRLHLYFSEGQTLRYGENSHQKASFYKDNSSKDSSVAGAEVLHGKAMSYNNYVDGDAALRAVLDLPSDQPATAVIKHTNPCGLATGSTTGEALARAWEGDPISAFGGVIATNQTVDMEFAEFLKGDKIKHISYMVKDGEYIPSESPVGKFVEIVIAPDFTEEAFEFLKGKSKMIRLLKYQSSENKEALTTRAITGGMLLQDRDNQLMDGFNVVTQREFPDNYRKLAEFTLVACKHTKSNGIVLGREYEPGKFQVLGMGAGQPNRVDSMRKLSIPKAKENLKREHENLGIEEEFESWWQKELENMVLVSDGFFPFDDTVREAAACGVKYLVQPGGSMRDKDSIAACDELGMAMAFTGLRHFNH